MKKYIALLLALVLAVGLCACGGGNKNATPVANKDNVVGTWRFEKGCIYHPQEKSFEIYKGGVAKIPLSDKAHYDYTWEIDGDILKVEEKNYGHFQAFEYVVNGDKEELHSTDGEIVLVKQ